MSDDPVRDSRLDNQEEGTQADNAGGRSPARRRRVILKTVIVLVLVIATQAAGNVFLSKGMRRLGEGLSDESSIALTVIRGMETPTIWLGITILAVSFVLFAAALSWADLSFVLPATSIGYVLNVACGRYFLAESVSPARWAAAALICLGVVFVGRSGLGEGPVSPAEQGGTNPDGAAK